MQLLNSLASCRFWNIVPLLKEDNINKHSLDWLRNKFKEQQSLLVKEQGRIDALKGKDVKKKNCALILLEKISRVIFCCPKSELKQLKKNKTNVKANISLLKYKIAVKQNHKINDWWEDNYDIIQACFDKESLNRFKTISFELLNRRYSDAPSRFLKGKSRLKKNLLEVQAYLKDDLKIRLGDCNKDKFFIKALMKHGNSNIEEIILPYLKFQKHENVFIINSKKKSS